MADQTSMAVQSPTGTVESFFDALQDQDFELAENLLAQNLVFQNVGMPTIYGRNRAMKMLRSAPGRMSLEVKIHRIAADGAAVLTERQLRTHQTQPVPAHPLLPGQTTARFDAGLGAQ